MPRSSDFLGRKYAAGSSGRVSIATGEDPATAEDDEPKIQRPRRSGWLWASVVLLVVTLLGVLIWAGYQQPWSGFGVRLNVRDL